MREEVLSFSCKGEQLIGVLHRPDKARKRAVLVVVGGPQTRVGSHRQFVLLARSLAARGYPCLRFDYRGMGDSTGSMRDFQGIDDDIQAALDALFDAVPGVEDVALWGLCDAASAALFIASREPRLSGLVLLNPWVRSEQGLARSYLKRYYLQRLFSRALWSKIVRGEFDYRGSWSSLVDMAKRASGAAGATSLPAGAPMESESTERELAESEPGSAGSAPAVTTAAGDRANAQSPAQSYPSASVTGVPSNEALAARMAAGLSNFNGRSLFILSGRDLTAGEFKDAVKESRQWRRLLKQPRVSVKHYAAADHTFSSRQWRDQVAAWTAEWLDSY